MMIIALIGLSFTFYEIFILKSQVKDLKLEIKNLNIDLSRINAKYNELESNLSVSRKFYIRNENGTVVGCILPSDGGLAIVGGGLSYIGGGVEELCK